jgi:hypothetical protein
MDVVPGRLRVLTATNGAPDKKPKISLSAGGWNARVLPSIVTMFKGD